MARRTDAPAPPAVDPWDATPEEERLNKVLAALQGEGKVKVSRRDEKGMLRYVGTLPLTDDFSEETVRENFGGGKYSLRFFLTPDNDSYATHMSMDIEGRPLERAAAGPAPAPAPSLLPTGAITADVANLHLQIAELKGMVAGLAAAVKDGGGASGGLAQLKDVAEIVRSLMPNAPAGAGGAADVFQVAREAMAFGKEVSKGGGGEQGFPWETVVDKAVLPLVDLAKKQAGTPGAPNPAPGAPAAKGPDMAALPAWARYVVAEQGFILQMAREGVEPATVATLLLDRWEKKMPAVEWAAFGDAVSTEGFAEEATGLAVQYLPGAAAVRPWLGQFLLAVAAEFAEEEPETTKVPEDEGGGGSTS